MRVWESDEYRAAPPDLVREQDFILKIRRLQRLGMPHQVVNLVLSATDATVGGRGLLEIAQDRAFVWAKAHEALTYEMSNGDMFIVYSLDKSVAEWPEELLNLVWPEELPPDKRVQALLTYTLPADYVLLRERLQHYVELAQRASSEADQASPSQLLQSDAARGPLTAWSTGQIERLLEQIDIYRYVRWQPVCERAADGKWRRLYEECYIGFEALRLERFPKLETTSISHLFLALCEALDQHLLAQLAEHPERLMERSVFLNLSVSSIIGGNFARFASAIPASGRGRIGFELHRGDLFQDFAATLNAIDILKREGFKIAIDSVSPHLLPYLNLHLFDVDYIKINVAKDRVSQLNDPAVRKALDLIPREKIIFFRCDSEGALMGGLTMGVSRFQGWLIDDCLHVTNT